MNEYQAFDPTSYLEHYGVKGMRWGVRRKRETVDYNKRNKSYSQNSRTRDIVKYGMKAEDRINRRMNKGMSLKSARRREFVRAIGRSAFVTASGLYIMAPGYYNRIAKQAAKTFGKGFMSGYNRAAAERAARRAILKIGDNIVKTY